MDALPATSARADGLWTLRRPKDRTKQPIVGLYFKSLKITSSEKLISMMTFLILM